METLLREISACQFCSDLPLGPNPIVQASTASRIVIIGQAPGTGVHETGIPWNDPSGRNLRKWMGVSDEQFYDPRLFALVPMGFCYPGKGASGDLPPRKACAPLWHDRLLTAMTDVQLILLFGQYAQKHYLGHRAKASLTETVRHYEDYLPQYLPMPHPSPRNAIWQKKNPWFQERLLPVLKSRVQAVLAQ